MKKYLYGTTALAAVGLAVGPVSAAEPLHLELGGWFLQGFGIVDTDVATETDKVSYQTGNVLFKMRGELDNGLVIGGHTELESFNTGTLIDESYLTIAGGFGEFRIGATNSGRYSYGWNTDAPYVGLPINSGWTSTWLTTLNTSGSRFLTPGLSTVIDGANSIGGDDQKLTYFTPRFNGFQLALSWTPSITANASQNLYHINASKADDYTDGWDIGLSYSGDSGGVGIEVQAGIAGLSASGDAKAAGFDDYFAYNGGVGLAFGNVAFGASFAVVDKGMFRTIVTDRELDTQNVGGTPDVVIVIADEIIDIASTKGRSFNTGIAYYADPWGFSVDYFNGQTEGLVTNPGDEENEFYSAAVSYNLGEGLDSSVTFFKGEKNDDLPGSAGDVSAKAVVFAITAYF